MTDMLDPRGSTKVSRFPLTQGSQLHVRNASETCLNSRSIRVSCSEQVIPPSGLVLLCGFAMMAEMRCWHGQITAYQPRKPQFKPCGVIEVEWLILIAGSYTKSAYVQ